MRLKLPKIGTPYIGASKTWRLMRWLIPIGMLGVVLLPELYAEFMRPKTAIATLGFNSPPPIAETATQFFFRIFIPTFLLYRLAIFIGERFWTKNPVRGAIVVVTAVALIPPFISGLLVQRTIKNMEFVDQVPSLKGKTVILDREGGLPFCAEDCFRLLYSSKVKQVIIEIPEHARDAERANKVETYRLGVAPNCNYDWVGTNLDVRPADIETWPATAAAMGQIVAGNCIVNGQNDSSKADFAFRSRWSMPEYNPQDLSRVYPKTMPTHGIGDAVFASLYKMENERKIEILRVNGRHKMEIARYPTSLTYFRRLYLTHSSCYGKTDRIRNKLVNLGLSYGAPDFIDMDKSKAMVFDLIENTKRPLSRAETYFIKHYVLRLRENGLSPLEAEQIEAIEADGRVYEQ